MRTANSVPMVLLIFLFRKIGKCVGHLMTVMIRMILTHVVVLMFARTKPVFVLDLLVVWLSHMKTERSNTMAAWLTTTKNCPKVLVRKTY